MRLARAMRRKAEKSAAVGDRRAVKTYAKAKKAVRHATTHELVMQAAVRRQAVVEIMATIVVAMHRSYGWGMDRLLRLRKKMRVQMECLKGRYVKLEEMEAIVEKELDWDFRLERTDTWETWRKVEYRAVRVMSAVFLIALHDEFGFGQKRAMRAYKELADIWTAIHNGSLTMEAMWKEHDAVGKSIGEALAL